MAKKLAVHEHKDIRSVVEHYLDYPYPMRNPEDEKTRLLKIHGEDLTELNHFLFQGRQDFNNKFRVLVAGGGTGDASTFMGEQLRNKNGEVVYLDFSANSLKIAKERAQNRGLTNIKFVHDSIFNIPKLDLGTFDYINCSGVLHHLSSPKEGLAILKDSLKPKGGMGIMLYAKYGRTAIYQLQDLMKMVNESVVSRQEEVENTKKILAGLPNTNWYMRSRDLIKDIENYGDIGIYDLLLHKQDRCYSIPELYEFIESADLNFVDFMEIGPRITLKIENYVKDADLLSQIKQMPIIKQQAIAEVISGNVIKHTFYASKIKDSTALYTDEDNVPFYHEIAPLSGNICDYLETQSKPEDEILNFQFKKNWVPEGISVNLKISRYTLPFFRSLGPGGSKSIGRLIAEVEEQTPNPNGLEILKEIDHILTTFVEASLMLLKHKSLL